MKRNFTHGALIEVLVEAVRAHGDLPVQRTPARGRSEETLTTYRELWTRAAQFAAALRARDVQARQPVLLLAENRAEWLVADLALLGLGAPSVPRGTESPPAEIDYIIGKVRASVALVEHPKLLARLPTEDRAPRVVILLSGEAPEGREDVLTLEGCISSQDPDAAVKAFDAAVAERKPEETATIVFTSGTTGQPKGVVLSQANLAANLQQAVAIIDFVPRKGRYLALLPPWHMFERLVEYALLSLGYELVYSSRRTFAKDLAAYPPDVLCAVPRLWVALMDGVLSKAAKAPKPRRLLFRLAHWSMLTRIRARRVRKGRLPRYSGEQPSNTWTGVGKLLRGIVAWPLTLILNALVWSKIRDALGMGRLTGGAAISGGGSLPEHVDEFFECLGVDLLNGYGLTETSPVLCLRNPRCNVQATVGRPLPETELSIRDPETGNALPPGKVGVVHARGPQIMQGYYEDEEATGRVLERDGWFDTGDLGRMTQSGELSLTGRAKDTIVLLSGENIDPEPLEDALTGSPFIDQAVVVGQDQKYLGALIVAADHLDSAGAQERLRQEIDRCVSPRKGFRQHERIARFSVLDRPLTVEEDLLSSTLKIKRQRVQDTFSDNIAGLYGD